MLKSFQTLTPGAGSSPLHCVNGKQSVSGVNGFMENEIWKPIPGFEGIFSISNIGRIKSHSRIADQRLRNGTTGKLIVKEKILCPWTTPLGYKCIRLWHKGNIKVSLVHRLVLMAFHGMPTEEKNCGMHLNHNPSDNRIENLMWGSQSDNMQMDWQQGRRKPHSHWTGKRNSKSPASKPVKQYSLNGEFIKEWSCAAEIERSTGISHKNISNNCRGITKKTGGFIFRFSINVGKYRAI